MNNDELRALILEAVEQHEASLRKLYYFVRKEADSRRVNWRAMIRRCEHPSSPDFPRYGGRGIKVCQRWQSFENFAADMGAKPEGGSIERTNLNLDYEPGNCRWATAKDQARNRGNTKRAANGDVLVALAESHGVNYWTAWSRIERGWDPVQAVTTPAWAKPR